jgi:hypothetical protein
MLARSQGPQLGADESVRGGIDLRRREEVPSCRDQLLCVAAEVLTDQSDVESRSPPAATAAPPQPGKRIELPDEPRVLVMQVLGQLTRPIQLAQRHVEAGLQRLGVSGKLVDQTAQDLLTVAVRQGTCGVPDLRDEVRKKGVIMRDELPHVHAPNHLRRARWLIHCRY